MSIGAHHDDNDTVDLRTEVTDEILKGAASFDFINVGNVTISPDQRHVVWHGAMGASMVVGEAATIGMNIRNQGYALSLTEMRLGWSTDNENGSRHHLHLEDQTTLTRSTRDEQNVIGYIYGSDLSPVENNRWQNEQTFRPPWTLEHGDQVAFSMGGDVSAGSAAGTRTPKYRFSLHFVPTHHLDEVAQYV